MVNVLSLSILFIVGLVYVSSHVDIEDYPALFEKIAKNASAVTDKVTTHKYQEMYGTHLMPHIKSLHGQGRNVKLLEVGLGCHMTYGAGVSALLWMRLLKESDEIWEADFDEKCVTEVKANGLLPKRINTLVGDQLKRADITRWVEESGAKTRPFDLIIDDGGHVNDMMFNTIDILFTNALAPGGFYFIEDLCFSRYPERLYIEKSKEIVMVDVIKDWIEQLLTPPPNPVKYPMPKGIKWIMCQFDACVIAKCKENDVAKCQL